MFPSSFLKKCLGLESTLPALSPSRSPSNCLSSLPSTLRTISPSQSPSFSPSSPPVSSLSNQVNQEQTEMSSTVLIILIIAGICFCLFIVLFIRKNMLKKRRREGEEELDGAIEFSTTLHSTGRSRDVFTDRESTTSGLLTSISSNSDLSVGTGPVLGSSIFSSVASFSSVSFSTLNNSYSVEEKDENERKLGTVEEEKEEGINENLMPLYYIADDESTLVPTLPPSTLGTGDSRNLTAQNEEDSSSSDSTGVNPTTVPTSSTQPEICVSSQESNGENWVE